MADLDNFLAMLWICWLALWFQRNCAKVYVRFVPAPIPEHLERLQERIETVWFEKTMVGEGFDSTRRFALVREGAPSVWITLSSKAPAGWCADA